jgi:hypothetical protein
MKSADRRGLHLAFKDFVLVHPRATAKEKKKRGLRLCFAIQEGRVFRDTANLQASLQAWETPNTRPSSRSFHSSTRAKVGMMFDVQFYLRTLVGSHRTSSQIQHACPRFYPLYLASQRRISAEVVVRSLGGSRMQMSRALWWFIARWPRRTSTKVGA